MKTPQLDRSPATQAALRSNLEAPAGPRSPLDALSRLAQGSPRRADSALAVRKDGGLDGSFDRALRDAGGDRERREAKAETDSAEDKDKATARARKKPSPEPDDARQSPTATPDAAQAGATAEQAPTDPSQDPTATLIADATAASDAQGLSTGVAAQRGAVATHVAEAKRNSGLRAKDGAFSRALPPIGAGTAVGLEGAASGLLGPVATAPVEAGLVPGAAEAAPIASSPELPSELPTAAVISKTPADPRSAVAGVSELATIAPMIAAARDSAPADASTDARGQVWSLSAAGPGRAAAEKAAASAGVPVASPPVEQQLAEGMTAALRHIPSPSGQRVVQIRLEPRDFGSVRVQLRVAGDAVAVRLVVGTKQAAEAVTRSMQDLRESVQRRGLRVESMGVEIDAALAPIEAQEPRTGAITGGQPAGTPLAEEDLGDTGAERTTATPERPASKTNEGGAFETLTLRLDQVA